MRDAFHAWIKWPSTIRKRKEALETLSVCSSVHGELACHSALMCACVVLNRSICSAVGGFTIYCLLVGYSRYPIIDRVPRSSRHRSSTPAFAQAAAYVVPSQAFGGPEASRRPNRDEDAQGGKVHESTHSLCSASERGSNPGSHSKLRTATGWPSASALPLAPSGDSAQPEYEVA